MFDFNLICFTYDDFYKIENNGFSQKLLGTLRKLSLV